ncbi:MAG: calcium-binding protein [Solirubrobacterales bacterium]
MSFSPASRRVLTAALCCGTALACAAPAGAAAPDQLWNCRASSAYTAMPGQDRNEPTVANGSARTSVESPDRGRCADDDARPVSAGQGLDLQGPTAATKIDPDAGLAVDQHITASSHANEASRADGTFVLVARGASAQAAAACSGTTAVLSGSSSVDDVIVNGQPVADTTQVQELTLPNNEVVRIHYNEQTRTGGTLIVRAIHAEFFNQAGQVVRETVVAEAKLSGGSEVCDRAAQTGGDGPIGSQDGRPCPQGSEYDPAGNVCIITRERDGNLANGRETVVVIGRPFESPSGGRVALPTEAPRSVRNSPCLKGKHVKYIVIGTNRVDKITGTNKSDAIFALGGNDQVGGGRGNDCIEGGTGGDRLSGSLGVDRLIGGRGGDNLNGGSQNDRLDGGAGNDTINAAFGRDRISGGAGNDEINVATAGPAARVNCGSGRDKVRSNTNERRRLRGCETRYSIR